MTVSISNKAHMTLVLCVCSNASIAVSAFDPRLITGIVSDAIIDAKTAKAAWHHLVANRAATLEMPEQVRKTMYYAEQYAQTIVFYALGERTNKFGEHDDDKKPMSRVIQAGYKQQGSWTRHSMYVLISEDTAETRADVERLLVLALKNAHKTDYTADQLTDQVGQVMRYAPALLSVITNSIEIDNDIVMRVAMIASSALTDVD